MLAKRKMSSGELSARKRKGFYYMSHASAVCYTKSPPAAAMSAGVGQEFKFNFSLVDEYA